MSVPSSVTVTGFPTAIGPSGASETLSVASAPGQFLHAPTCVLGGPGAGHHVPFPLQEEGDQFWVWHAEAGGLPWCVQWQQAPEEPFGGQLVPHGHGGGAAGGGPVEFSATILCVKQRL